ncbi:MAG: DUF2249 domain-containing protein [Desertimonas sp.]
MPTTELDVRPMPPAQRHTTIFARLGELTAGDTLRLVNDHDPKPLRYQLDAEHPGEFRWSPAETGPERWVVDITSRAHVVDARPVIAGGGEPFELIMAAAAAVGEDEVLVVLAPFDPIPLQGVLAEQGFRFVSDQLGPDDWRTTFLR